MLQRSPFSLGGRLGSPQSFKTDLFGLDAEKSLHSAKKVPLSAFPAVVCTVQIRHRDEAFGEGDGRTIKRLVHNGRGIAKQLMEIDAENTHGVRDTTQC